MPDPSGYLVVHRSDGFGDVTPLLPGKRYGVGRAPTNAIVLRDDLCSRNHAEVLPDGKGWAVRDLGSLNGSAINEKPVKGDVKLGPRDVVRFGRSQFVFVENLEQLPALLSAPKKQDLAEGIEITQRLDRTKFLPQSAPVSDDEGPPTPSNAGTIAKAKLPEVAADKSDYADSLAILFRLAVDMNDASSPAELAELVLEALLSATPAEVAAALILKDNRELETVAHKAKLPERATYHKVSQFVSREVLTTKQAVLAEDIPADESLKNRDSISDLKATSLVCAPILHEGKALGLLHLYRTTADKRLDANDLEFALAVAQQLGAAWHRVQKERTLTVENRALRDQLRIESDLVGASDALRDVETQIARVATTKATVLIRGESGVGKELVARAIHFGSPRRGAPFVCLNCAALTETLLESELFGHEKGAFTGATERMAGKFEVADTGTIFLDEIGEMNVSTQAKLLRVLEGQSFERVGGNTPIKVDVRVVSATNRPLEEAVRSGTFRRDLYFRLQVVQIDVPPLRERPDDIPAIAEHFLKRFARETGRKVKGFSPAALKKLVGHRWPGNVRELRNVVERAVALGSTQWIEELDLRLSPLEALDDAPAASGAYEPITLQELEKQHIEQTLEHTDWNKSRTAEILGIERSTLDRKIKAYGIKR